MIGETILIIIATILSLSIYIFVLIETVQSIRYDRFDKRINIIEFSLMTIVILAVILVLVGV